MTPVGLIGFILSFAILPFVSAGSSQKRLPLLSGLMTVHFGTAVVYYLYALSNSADSALYYQGLGLEHWKFAFGTVFVVQLVHTMRETIGGSYLDYFLIFQAFGFWGIAVLVRIFDEIHAQLGTFPSRLPYALLFLPGLHFWSSALGKDAPLLFGISLSVWSALALRRRIIFFAAALGVMVLFRPHIALITVASLAVSAAIAGRLSLGARVGLWTVALAAATTVASTVESTLDVKLSNADSVSDFFARKSGPFQEVSGTTTVHGASFPVKLFGQLFRPLFIDAHGVFGIVASFESIALIAIFWFLARNWREVYRVTRSVFFLQFVATFFVVLTFLLSMLFYNVGLGLRQKIMLYPALLSFFAAHWAYHLKVRAMSHLPPHASAAPPGYGTAGVPARTADG